MSREKNGPNSMPFTTTSPASPGPNEFRDLDPQCRTESPPETTPPETGRFPTRKDSNSDIEMVETSTSPGSNGGRDRTNCRRSETPRFPAENDFGSHFEMTEISISSGSNGSQTNGSQTTTVQLPKYLRLAPRKDITSDELEAIDPVLKADAMKFILDSFKFLGPRLHTIAATSIVDMPRGRAQVPQELEVIVNNISAHAPTHILAIQAKHIKRMSLYPVHGIIFAMQCGSLPPVPHSKPTIPAKAGDKLTLPVLPLLIPSPATFPIIKEYLYTKCVDHIYAALLPISVQGARRSTHHLSQTCAATFTIQALLSYADRVHGLWANVQALGVFDEKLSQAIETAWEVLLGALMISTGARWETA